MKKFQRFLALALALLLTVSCFPVNIFAVGDPAPQSEPGQVVYDFDLADNYADTISNSGNFSIEDQLDTIQGLYDADTVNWIYEGKGVADGGNGTFSRNQFNKTEGIRIYTSGHDWWYAIRLKSPGTGTYDITVNSYTAKSGTLQKHSVWTEAYLFDAAPIDAEETTIAASLTEANKLASNFSPLTEQPSVGLGEFTFTEGNAYILVFRETLELYRAANEDGLRTSNLYLNNITMTLSDNVPDETTGSTETTTTAPEETTTTPEETTTTPEETTTAPEETTTAPSIPEDLEAAGYSFDLKNVYDDIVTGDFSVEDADNLVYTQALYNAGKISWLFAGSQNGNTKADGTGDPAESFTKNYYNKGSGIQVRTTGYNWWYAIKVKAPGTGTYDVTINTVTAKSGDLQKHSVWTETYIFDAALVTGDTGINDLLTEENKYQDFAPTTENTAAFVGNVAFTEGKEYIIVLRQTIDTFRAANVDGLRTANLYLNNIAFVAAEPPVTPPPVDEPVGPEIPEDLEAAGYNFDLKTFYDNIVTGDFSVEDAENIAYTNALYAAGKISWLFEAKQNGTTASGDPAESFVRNQYNKGLGIQAYTSGYDWWYALRVKAPGTGTYDVTINTNLVTSGGVQKHSMWTETYIFDAAKVTGTTTINDLLIKENKCRTFAPTTENPAAYVGNVAFTEGKDYIIVLRITSDTRSQANVDGLRTNNLYLKNIEFVAAEPPVIEIPKTGYDFNLVTNYPEEFTEGEIENQLKLIQEYYEKGYISWSYLGKNPVGEDSKAAFDRNWLMKGAGIQLRASNYEWYYAIRFRSPGKGAHKVEIDTYLASTKDANGNPIQKHSVWTNAYIVEASLLDNGKATIEDCLLKRNLVGACNPTVEKPMAEVGYYTFEADKEYVLILRQTRSSYALGKETTGLTTNNLYLNGLKFTYTANPPAKVVDTSKVIYDFDLRDSKTGIYSKDVYINEKVEDTARLYDLEEINWKLAGPSGTDAKFKATGGLTSYGKADDYVAIKIQSPGKGLYTLSLNHGKSGRGAVGAVYILPADTEDIAFAMDNSNRVGKLEFHNDSGDVKLQDGYTSVVGTWEFGSAKEYILVIEAYDKSPYATQAYMYFSQLICEKGDKTTTQGVRVPHATVVDPAPVKSLETCTYIAVGEVNGDDYLYLPLEGKKMAVYNLDTKELVDYTETPFTQVKGICVDDDGILWAVGDNPYIYKYDPVLNVGESVYYYKNTTGVERTDSIIGVSCSFGLHMGDDGCLYFGAYPVGVLGKYNVATGEFTNMGTVGTGDANCYASVPFYDNGYVYVTTTGDTNSDGVKTMELSKFNAVTNELVMRKDITQYLSQQEVMVRGMGICGGVIVMGGERNDVKKVAAFDTETLEFVDLGIQSAAIYGPSGKLDNKFWIFTSTEGVWEFDGATRTVTPVKGMENLMGAMRCHEGCFVTVEGNDLFPGKSILTWRGNDSDPIAIYNMTTGRYMRLGDDIIQPEYGSTSNIRPIVKVPGDNSQVYIGAFNTSLCSVYDTAEGKITKSFLTNGQTDAILLYQGKLFVGNYNQGVLTQVNLDDEHRNVPLMSLKAEYKQSRIHALASGDNKVFVGSCPDRYELGGCIAWIDLETFDKHVERNVVQDQSIIAVAYDEKSGCVIGGSCAKGGSGSIVPEGTSAKFFIYDVANKQKVAEYDLRDYFKDIPAEVIQSIRGLTVDENGKVWMSAIGSLFTFTIDPTTKEMRNLRREANFGYADNSEWQPTAMLQIDGYLYANFGNVGGVQKVNMSNPSDSERIPIPATNFFAIGDDGNVYFTPSNQSLYIYPMVVTDEDRKIAEDMDAVFAKLKNNTTLESEADIIAAREAYEALTWTQKCLVYNLDYLTAAEIDLLECKIDALGEITLEDKDAIMAIKAEYNTLSAKNKTYVKNYRTVLVPALQALQALIDADEAARVQALIDTIPGMGEITLDKEAAIREIETAYNELTKSQKALVDAKHLEDALAKIQALRQERIAYLNKLIAGLGEITLEDEPVINEAMEIFNWLTVTEREKVDYLTLTAAETALKKLQKAAAAEVDALIEAIGDTVSHSSGDAIAAARAAYDALTPGSKQYVKLLPILEEAEALFATLGLHPAIIIAIVAVVVVAAGVAVFIILRKKRAVKA